jgi:hypothetical protein
MEEEHITVCSVCGFPLKEHEVHGLISGRMHVSIGDGKENRFNITMHLCKECIRKVTTYITMEVLEAKERIDSLENYG